MDENAIAIMVVISNCTFLIVKLFRILSLDDVYIEGRLYETDDKVKVFGVELTAELLVKVCRRERHLVVL